MLKRLILLCALLSLTGFASEKPNVVMIVLDDLNDFVGVMGGNPQAKTPNIDRLAGQGILFNNAHSNAPVCSPSRASFMTGIAPYSSKNYGFKNWLNNPVLINSKTIPEYARENGYEAYQTGKILHNLKKGIWTQKGVKTDYGPYPYDGKKITAHPHTPKGLATAGGAVDGTFESLANIPTVDDYTGWVNYNWTKTTPFRYISDTDRDKMTDEKSLDFFKDKISKLAKRNNAKPFFFALGFVRPHTPLVVPQKYYDMFPLDSIKLNIKQEDRDDCKLSESNGPDGRGRKVLKGLLDGAKDPNLMLKKYMRAYLASIAFADEMVGGVIDTIENSRFNENTIIMLFSDHGYNIGEKDYLWKYNLWEDTTRVPLIIKHPAYPQHAGKVVTHPVSLIDIFPTIKDACKMQGDTKINASGANLDGHSLMPFVKDPEAKWSGPDVALSTLTTYRSKKPQDQHNAVRSKHYRYILYGNGAEELYDHRNDRHEWNNQADNPEYKEVKESLKRQMVEILNKAQNPKQLTKETEKISGEEWKAQYFKKFPEADSNKDGVLSWPEYKAHKNSVKKG